MTSSGTRFYDAASDEYLVPIRMTIANGEYATELQVRWSECDPAGVAYYANYFSFYEAAVVAFMEERGTSWHALLEVHGVRFPRVDARCRYLASVTFGDHIRVGFHVAELRPRVATMRFTIDRVRDGVRAAEGEVVVVCVPRQAPGAAPGRAIELPAPFRDVFTSLLPPSPPPEHGAVASVAPRPYRAQRSG